MNLQEAGKKDYTVRMRLPVLSKVVQGDANAFVIQEISLIDGDIEKSKLAEYYLAVKSQGIFISILKRKECSYILYEK